MADFRIGRRIRHFAERDLFEKLWALPVWLGLGFASLMIVAVPFKYIAPRLGINCGTTKPVTTLSGAGTKRASQIGRTVKLAASYAPWRADCYPQAIMARLLLGIYRLPYTVSMGLRRDPAQGAMLAHAWVECGDVCVTGGDGNELFKPVGIFASRNRVERGCN